MRILLALALLFISNGDVADCRAAEVGDAAPEFSCLDDRGQLWTLKEQVGKGPIILYFYPSDFSFCCTRQAGKYRDKRSDFAQAGAHVIGISGDDVEAHRLFKAANQLPQTLLSDSDGRIAESFGVPLRVGGKAMTVSENGELVPIPRRVTVARWTFVIANDGRIVMRIANTSPLSDSQTVLDFLNRAEDE